MTDRELMQQALETLTEYDGTNGESKRKRVLAALRERLAQPEYHDPIGDAQDKLIAEQHDYRTRYDRGCYKCGSHYCPANCPEPTHLVNVDAVNMTQERVDETAKVEHEPVVKWDASAPLVFDCPRCGHCCQQRQWVGLTKTEMFELFEKYSDRPFSLMLATHDKAKEKNGG